MDVTRKVNWRRGLTEGAIIVVSILLAFWIDAWWDESQQREREVILLQSLLDDLQRIRTRLDTDRRLNEAVLESTITLLRAAGSGSHNLTPKDVDRLVGDLLWYSDASHWESAPMGVLSTGGDLVLLNNVDLVQKLGLLHKRLDGVQRIFRRSETFYYENILPFLSSNANVLQIFAGIEHRPGSPDFLYEFPEIDLAKTDDHSGLLANAEFQGLLIKKYDITQHDTLRLALAGLDDHLDEIIAVLEDELGN